MTRGGIILGDKGEDPIHITSAEYDFLMEKFDRLPGTVNRFFRGNYFICMAALAVYRSERDGKDQHL